MSNLTIKFVRFLTKFDDQIPTFLFWQARPLKAVLFTTKTDIPPLWQQLYEAQSMTTAFGVRVPLS